MKSVSKKRTSSTSISRRLKQALKGLDKNRLEFLKGSGPEALHDFRVSLRRVRTLLRLMKSPYPTRTLKGPLGLLRKIAQQTNALRDQEVFCVTLNSLPLLRSPTLKLERWVNSQDDLRRGLELEIREYLGSTAVAKKLVGLSTTLGISLQTIPEAELRGEVHRRFKKERRRLILALEKAASNKAGRKNLHRLRVEAKKVRYALEELEFIMPHQGRKLAASCRKIQDRLGEWRDWDNALSILKEEHARFHETKPWRRELQQRKETAWKSYLKAADALQKRLES